MKKSLSLIIVCLLMCVCSITMFACGKKGGDTDAYKALSEFIETVEKENKNNHMFSSGFVDGVESDYILTEYYNDSTYNYYNQSLIIPMNFIKTYHSDLQKIKSIKDLPNHDKALINELAKDIPELNKAYQDSVDKFLSLKAVTSAPVVEEGARQRYVQSLKTILKASYNIALKLANIKDQVFNDYRGLLITAERLNSSQVATLRDYFSLMHANDYYNCLIVNLEMEDFTSISGTKDVESFVGFIQNVKKNFSSSLALQAIKNEEFADLTGQLSKFQEEDGKVVNKYDNKIIEKTFDAFEYLQNTRKRLEKALQEISLYNYYVKYSCNMDACSVDVKYATNYFNEISNYFTSYSGDYVNYLTNLLKTGA